MSKIYTINNQNVKFLLLTHIRVVSIGNRVQALTSICSVPSPIHIQFFSSPLFCKEAV